MIRPDPALTRLVSRHFNDLQGYRRVLTGISLLTGSGVYLATGSELLFGVALGLALGASFLLPMKTLDAFYAARFGRVVQDRAIDRRIQLLSVSGAVASVWFGSRALWLMLGVYPAWLALSGWPHRRHQLLEVGAALCAAWMLPNEQPLTMSHLADGLMLLGIASVFTGFADHALLERALPRKVMSDTSHVHADTL